MTHLVLRLVLGTARRCVTATYQQPVTEWEDSLWHINTVRLHSAIHVGSRGKIQDRRQIKNTDDTQTKHNAGKANNTKHSKTKLSWFSHLLRHSAKKWGATTGPANNQFSCRHL